MTQRRSAIRGNHGYILPENFIKDETNVESE
jgi:hypothetical protein